MAPNDRLQVPGQLYTNAGPPNGEVAPAPRRSSPAKAVTTKKKDEQPAVKDAFREVVETIVFVIVLVLLLKTFVAEAFVIPTGSMAETLLGYQKWVDVPAVRLRVPCELLQRSGPATGPAGQGHRLHLPELPVQGNLANGPTR